MHTTPLSGSGNNNNANEPSSQRLEALIDNITKTIFTNVCRGLFEKDKLTFSFLIATSINKRAKLLDEGLWSALLRGAPAGVLDKATMPANPDK